jgi:hypothetical protein
VSLSDGDASKRKKPEIKTQNRSVGSCRQKKYAETPYHSLNVLQD